MECTGPSQPLFSDCLSARWIYSHREMKSDAFARAKSSLHLPCFHPPLAAATSPLLSRAPPKMHLTAILRSTALVAGLLGPGALAKTVTFVITPGPAENPMRLLIDGRERYGEVRYQALDDGTFRIEGTERKGSDGRPAFEPGAVVGGMGVNGGEFEVVHSVPDSPIGLTSKVRIAFPPYDFGLCLS